MKNEKLERRHLETDVLIIGGGTAGCYAAIRLGAEKDLRVLVVEKANIERSGCLAAGVNALNAYISNGHTPADYVEYARRDAEGIIRDDLMMTIAESVNAVTEDLERRGLVILKDAEGHYVTRGWRNVKINGENIKPLLAKGVREQENVTVLNHVNITDLKVTDGAVHGAWGFSVRERMAYDIEAKAVLIATGGAAGSTGPTTRASRATRCGIRRSTRGRLCDGHPGRRGDDDARTPLRRPALQGHNRTDGHDRAGRRRQAGQCQGRGLRDEVRAHDAAAHFRHGGGESKGNGPCYLDTRHITAEQQSDLYHAYLNMAPAQTLKWIESGKGPKEQPVEVEGTEPYVVGGHTASGFWVDTNRETTIHGLFAAGDVAGGAPQKYVTGALAEGRLPRMRWPIISQQSRISLRMEQR